MYKDLIQNKEIYSLQLPKTIVPTPTSDDYDNGVIQRYFIQKANDSNGFAYEVSQTEYEEYFRNPYWVSQEMRWRITGPLTAVYADNGSIIDKGVIESNKTSISIAAVKIKNISLYLPNLLQFHK